MKNSLSNKKIFFDIYQEPFPTDYYQLPLRKISSITDEEILEYHLFFHNYYSKDDISSIERIVVDDNIIKCLIFNKNYHHPFRVDIDIRYNINIGDIDWLRSKGFILPFMDLSIDKIIEYGWATIVD